MTAEIQPENSRVLAPTQSPTHLIRVLPQECCKLSTIISSPPKRWSLDVIKGVSYFKSGRVALYTLLAHMAQRSDRREIILPAYHCDSIIRACEWSGLVIRYFRVKPDLTPDLEDLREKLSSDTLAILMIHYFGFLNDIGKATELSRSYGATVIEDAAHLNLANDEVRARAGIFGDWVISSPRKFYPLYDGAIVYPGRNNNRMVHLKKIRSSLAAEARSLKHCLSAQLYASKPSTSGVGAPPPDDNASEYRDSRFFPDASNAMTSTSRVFLRRMAATDTARVRRRNYGAILKQVQSLPGCRPLFNTIPESVEPYVFPLILRRPDTDHSALRSNGLLVYRWEALANTDCLVSKQYEIQLVQVPCHQDLSADDLNYICQTLRATLS